MFATLWTFATTAWDWQPSVLFGCAALMILYFLAAGFRFGRTVLFFGTGILVLLLALESPIDKLGDSYLLSAHMIQHLLLIMVTPPLPILGLPTDLARKARQRPFVSQAERILSTALVPWVLGIGTVVVWHLPILYEAALENEGVHVIEHLCFMASAFVFWWPILSPLPERRLQPGLAIPYLMAAGTVTTLLGIFIAYYPSVLYTTNLQPPDPLRILAFFQDRLGLYPKQDQELAGLLMWVPRSFVYLGAIMVSFSRLFDESEEPGEAAP